MEKQNYFSASMKKVKNFRRDIFDKDIFPDDFVEDFLMGGGEINGHRGLNPELVERNLFCEEQIMIFRNVHPYTLGLLYNELGLKTNYWHFSWSYFVYIITLVMKKGYDLNKIHYKEAISIGIDLHKSRRTV